MQNLGPGVAIREIAGDDLESLRAAFSGAPWNHPDDRWAGLLVAHREEVRHVALALSGDVLVGYCSLLYRSEYPPFDEAGIPEIHGLAVAEHARRRGVGRSLILHLEDTARRRRYSDIGVGVGLDQKFGQAQRLYVKLGYVPDGRGVTPAGSQKPKWGFPILWLTKTLNLEQELS